MKSLPEVNNHSLLELYSAFEQTINCVDSDQLECASLPRFNGNKSQPIHQWFTFKEGFSANLLSWVCKLQNINIDDLNSILDPFCGVGTSLLSAQLSYRGNHPLNLFGIERNPFIAFVAHAKLAWSKYRIDRIRMLIPKLVTAARERPTIKVDLPDLTTIQNQEAFNRRRLNDLLYARQLIEEELGDSPERDFFFLGWASIIETVSNLRKDGRALRFVSKQVRPPVYKLLENQWDSMLADLTEKALLFKNIPRGSIDVSIVQGDGRTLGTLDNRLKIFDLIIYSPPYPNNIDYSEVYKLELWLSNLVTTQKEFKELRLSTFRSHPSIRFPETDYIQALPSNSWSRKMLDTLLSSIPRDEDYAWRVRLMKSYVDDVLISLQSQLSVAKKGAYNICVVGNSLHGRREKPIVVATDLLISALARDIGFSIERLQVSRQLYRRDHRNELLRESIIVMRRT